MQNVIRAAIAAGGCRHDDDISACRRDGAAPCSRAVCSGALTEVVKAFEAEQRPQGAGQIRRLRACCATKSPPARRPQVFASANMEHPQALATAGKSGPVMMFARNTALRVGAARASASTARSLLERMLDPHVKVGTSTPKADPSGDYAFEVFAKAEAIKPGARAALEGKALQAHRRADSAAAPPDGRNVYGWHVAEGAPTFS